MKLKFKRLRAEARIHAFGHDDPTNAGLDLFLAESRDLYPGEDAWIGTGITWEPEEHVLEIPHAPGVSQCIPMAGWKPALFIRPRSSLAKLGLESTEGTVDMGYRGEIMVHVWNRGKKYVKIQAGERIAQAVPILLPSVEVEEVEELNESIRGDRGFGSSGR